MSDDESTPEERREAEALARALEGRPAEGVPADALATAALLRYARSEGRLDPARAAAVGRRLQPGLRRWWWLAVVPVAAAAAGIVIASRAPLRLPPPPKQVLSTQAAAAHGGVAELDALDRQMRAYRRALFAAGGAR
jgi:hypothetical protein